MSKSASGTPSRRLEQAPHPAVFDFQRGASVPCRAAKGSQIHVFRIFNGEAVETSRASGRANLIPEANVSDVHPLSCPVLGPARDVGPNVRGASSLVLIWNWR